MVDMNAKCRYSFFQSERNKQGIDIEVELVFDPPRTPDRIKPEVRKRPRYLD
jgi:metal-sulfur cluster biosynthetic enzyme